MSPALQHRLLFALLMSSIMSLFMSGWVTLINIGPSALFLSAWLKAFLMTWPAAFTIVTLLGPTIQKKTAQLLQYIHQRRSSDAEKDHR